jgi:hypothetical protein
MSPCRHAEEVADTVVVILIFIRVATKKLNSPYLLTVVGRRRQTLNTKKLGIERL